MQQRFHVSWHKDFPSAHVAKEEAIINDLTHNFQIRKKDKGRKFELVIRIPEKEQIKNPEQIIRKRRAR